MTAEIIPISDYLPPRKSREERMATALFRLQLATLAWHPEAMLRYSQEFYAALYEGMPESGDRPCDTEP